MIPSLRIRYRTLEIGPVDIHVRTLRDRCQFLDEDDVAKKLGISSAAWPIFGVIWPSSKVLAHTMLDYKIEGKRILEVGCGIALASLILNYRLADITATDVHPEVKSFLSFNVALNNGEEIPFVRTGWNDDESELGTFDLIIGSDLLYERGHADSLSKFINLHARQKCDVMIVDPDRGHHAKFSKKMVAMGYTRCQKKVNTNYLNSPFKCRILSYSR